MSTPFRISKHDAGEGVAHLTVAGDLDRDTSEVLTTVIGNALREGAVRELVVDLRHVGFLDSMGVRALLVGQDAAAAHGSGWRMANVHGVVRRVLDMAGLVHQLNADAPEVAAARTGPLPG